MIFKDITEVISAKTRKVLVQNDFKRLSKLIKQYDEENVFVAANKLTSSIRNPLSFMQFYCKENFTRKDQIVDNNEILKEIYNDPK